ncbi:hypothetical protein Tco_1182615 [Tanacetum coccineum]
MVKNKLHRCQQDTGTAPQPQLQIVPQTLQISNIKLPILKKGGVDIWQWRWSRIKPFCTLTMKYGRDSSILNRKEAIRTRFGGNANSKKMQKAVFKQQFEAFKISNSKGLEKGYDRFQQLLSQLEAHSAEVSTEDANHKFLRSLPLAWSNLAMTMRTNPEIDNLSIDDLYYNNPQFS